MSKKIVSRGGGIGESKPFIAPDQFDPNPQRHVGGAPVGGGYLDHLMASALSDEEQAERDKKPKARVQVLADHSDPIGKALQERRDFLKNSPEPWLAPNQMESVMRENLPEGHRGRFLSPQRIQERGLRGWQPVIKDGAPVKLGNMVLGSMPEDLAERRNKFFREKDADRLKQHKENTEEQMAKAAHAAKLRMAPGEIGLKRSVGNDAAVE